MNHTKVGPFAAMLTAGLLGCSEAIAAQPTTVPLSIVHNYRPSTTRTSPSRRGRYGTFCDFQYATVRSIALP